MKRYSKHQIALIAELLADKLVCIYQGEQVSAMVDGFASAGFTKASLQDDPEKLFQMLAIAAYDRRPFTPAAGGFEEIWGIHPSVQSIPKALKELSLFTPQEVQRLDQDAIHRRLDGQLYFGQSLATDGGSVRFARTLLDLARLIEDGFHSQVLESHTTEDVQEIYRRVTGAHGIGDTIGAKLVKYLLREIGVGHVPTRAFPLAIVWPLADEYHVNAAIEVLSARLDISLTPLAMGLLFNRGEPFAIDALFYLHRHREWELQEFIEEARGFLVAQRASSASRTKASERIVDKQLGQRLLSVIEEIYGASRGISLAEIKRAGLQGVVTPQQIEGSGRWLFIEMGKLATEGKVGEMVVFYENCLHSERGKLVGWALRQLGRTSMESEADRFRAIHEDRAT